MHPSSVCLILMGISLLLCQFIDALPLLIFNSCLYIGVCIHEKN